MENVNEYNGTSNGQPPSMLCHRIMPITNRENTTDVEGRDWSIPECHVVSRIMNIDSHAISNNRFSSNNDQNTINESPE